MGDGDLMPKQLSKQRDMDMRRLEIKGTVRHHVSVQSVAALQAKSTEGVIRQHVLSCVYKFNRVKPYFANHFNLQPSRA